MSKTDRPPPADERLGELMSARLCHDLIGPAGAVLNGMEILGDAAIDCDAEILQLLTESSQRLAQQLSFFRLAFGLRGGVEAAATAAEARSLALGYFDPTRIAIVWSPDRDGDVSARSLPAPTMRIALVLLMVAADALPRGGALQVEVHADGDGHAAVTVTATGPGAQLPSRVAAAMAPDADIAAVTARTVHAYLAARLAARFASAIATACADDRVALTVTLPLAAPTNA